jgi:hypothetical protein
MSYYTYWDINTASSGPMADELVILYGAIAISIAGFALLLLRKFLPVAARNSIPFGTMALGALMLVSYFYIDFAKKKTPKTAVINKELVAQVEGKIENYKEKIQNAPRGGTQTLGSFDIKGISFHFSGVNQGTEPRFDLTRRKGGILQNGLQARIQYDFKRNTILKIELQNDSPN